MFAEERQRQILEILQRDKRAEADTLATMLDVSRETIRRDLKSLEKAGHVHRTHGGALISRPVSEEPFSRRIQQRTTEKRAIATAAARLVEPGQCCFVDAGSTTASFAPVLATIPGIALITNAIEVAIAVHMAQPQAEILLLGGVLGRDVPATFGGEALNQLSSLRADIAFVSPVGIDADAGVSYFDLSEADIARAMLKHARRRIVLADASKCGIVSRAVVCGCSEVDVLVTDYANTRMFEAAGVGRIVRAGDQTGQAGSKSRKRS